MKRRHVLSILFGVLIVFLSLGNSVHAGIVAIHECRITMPDGAEKKILFVVNYGEGDADKEFIEVRGSRLANDPNRKDRPAHAAFFQDVLNRVELSEGEEVPLMFDLTQHTLFREINPQNDMFTFQLLRRLAQRNEAFKISCPVSFCEQIEENEQFEEDEQFYDFVRWLRPSDGLKPSQGFNPLQDNYPFLKVCMRATKMLKRQAESFGLSDRCQPKKKRRRKRGRGVGILRLNRHVSSSSIQDNMIKVSGLVMNVVTSMPNAPVVQEMNLNLPVGGAPMSLEAMRRGMMPIARENLFAVLLFSHCINEMQPENVSRGVFCIDYVNFVEVCRLLKECRGNFVRGGLGRKGWVKSGRVFFIPPFMHRVMVSRFFDVACDDADLEIFEAMRRDRVADAVPACYFCGKKTQDLFERGRGGYVRSYCSQECQELDDDLPACSVCGTETLDILRCGRCKRVLYCGRDCQREDWPRHRSDCAGMQRKPRI